MALDEVAPSKSSLIASMPTSSLSLITTIAPPTIRRRLYRRHMSANLHPLQVLLARWFATFRRHERVIGNEPSSSSSLTSSVSVPLGDSRILLAGASLELALVTALCGFPSPSSSSNISSMLNAPTRANSRRGGALPLPPDFGLGAALCLEPAMSPGGVRARRES